MLRLLFVNLADGKLSRQGSRGRTSFARIRRFKHLIKFFQRASVRFHVEEVDKRKLEQVPKDEEYIEPISDLLCLLFVSLRRVEKSEGRACVEDLGKKKGEGSGYSHSSTQPVPQRY